MPPPTWRGGTERPRCLLPGFVQVVHVEVVRAAPASLFEPDLVAALRLAVIARALEVLDHQGLLDEVVVAGYRLRALPGRPPARAASRRGTEAACRRRPPSSMPVTHEDRLRGHRSMTARPGVLVRILVRLFLGNEPVHPALEALGFRLLGGLVVELRVELLHVVGRQRVVVRVAEYVRQVDQRERRVRRLNSIRKV